MQYQEETIQAYRKLTEGTQAWHDHQQGLMWEEPCIVLIDSLLKYARAYRKRYGRALRDEAKLKEIWLKAAVNVRRLFEHRGAVATEWDITTRGDSKDNGCLEEVFWKAMEVAGLTEDDIDAEHL